MLEVHIGYHGLEKLAAKLSQTPKVIVAAEKKAVTAAAPKMKAIVDQEIGGSGRVKSWQGQYVGSEGLYAAVRPKKETYAKARERRTYAEEGPGRHAVGYVTNAINSGHRARPDKFGYRRSPVTGKGFYQRAQIQLDQVVKETANQIDLAWQTFWEDNS